MIHENEKLYQPNENGKPYQIHVEMDVPQYKIRSYICIMKVKLIYIFVFVSIGFSIKLVLEV